MQEREQKGRKDRALADARLKAKEEKAAQELDALLKERENEVFAAQELDALLKERENEVFRFTSLISNSLYFLR